jgi:phage shock protein C
MTMSRRNEEQVQYGLYRSRKGMILGVAKGLAMSSRLPVWFVRLGFIFFAILTQVIPTVVVYIVLAIVMRPEPVIEFTSDEDREFYNNYGNARRPALLRMRSILSKLDKRVQRLENAITDPENDWERRFRNS